MILLEACEESINIIFESKDLNSKTLVDLVVLGFFIPENLSWRGFEFRNPLLLKLTWI